MLVARIRQFWVPRALRRQAQPGKVGEDGRPLKWFLGAKENEGSGSHPQSLLPSLAPPSRSGADKQLLPGSRGSPYLATSHHLLSSID